MNEKRIIFKCVLCPKVEDVTDLKTQEQTDRAGWAYLAGTNGKVVCSNCKARLMGMGGVKYIKGAFKSH